MWDDKVWRSPVKWLGVVGAVALLCGCTALGTVGDSTASSVNSILKDSGQPVFTRLVLSPDPDDTRVAVRADGAEVWRTEQGAGDPVAQPSVTGASRPDAVDFDALNAQLDVLAASCDHDPELNVGIAASGAVVADSVCGGQITATSVDGREPVAAQIELTSVEGIDQILNEASAMLPNRRAFQISLPGPASSRGDSARAEGGTWTLTDGTICTVSYLRAGQGTSPSEPLREFSCDGFGQQKVGFNTQQPFDPATLDAGRIHDAIGKALSQSGFDPQTVAFYGVYEFYTGPLLVLVTTDGGYHEVDI